MFKGYDTPILNKKNILHECCIIYEYISSKIYCNFMHIGYKILLICFYKWYLRIIIGIPKFGMVGEEKN